MPACFNSFFPPLSFSLSLSLSLSLYFSLSLSRSANAEEGSSESTKAITDGTSSTEAQSSSAQQDPAQTQGGGASSSGVGGSPHDSDKQERIERYVRMSISNQVEQQLLTQQNRQVSDVLYVWLGNANLATAAVNFSQFIVTGVHEIHGQMNASCAPQLRSCDYFVGP
jgi:hypothetical protein